MPHSQCMIGSCGSQKFEHYAPLCELSAAPPRIEFLEDFEKRLAALERKLLDSIEPRLADLEIDKAIDTYMFGSDKVHEQNVQKVQLRGAEPTQFGKSREDISKKLDALVAANVEQDATYGEFVQFLDNAVKLLAEVSDRIAQSSATESQVAKSSKVLSQMESPQPVLAWSNSSSEALASVIEIATEVRILCTIERIFNLDTIEQSFCVQVNTRMLWECPDTETPPATHEDDGDWEPEWTPKLYFKNLLELIIEQVYYTTILHNGVRYIKCEDRRLMKLAEPLELKAFPVDCQHLHICVECKMTISQCRFSLLPNFETGGLHNVARLEESMCILNDFRLIEQMPSNFNMFIAEHADRRVSSIEMSVNLQRSCFYYVVNVWFVGMIIVSFVFCSWGLHPGDVANRLGTDLTLILTVIAFRLVLADMLPRMSYMIYLDMYTMGSFLFLMFVTVLHATFPYTMFSKIDLSAITLPPTAFPGNEQDFIDEDFILMCACAGVWAAFNLYFAVFVWARRQCLLKEFVKDARQRQKEADAESDEIKDCHSSRSISAY